VLGGKCTEHQYSRLYAVVFNKNMVYITPLHYMVQYISDIGILYLTAVLTNLFCRTCAHDRFTEGTQQVIM